ncbi:MAG: malonyl CoA-acyl carrier protein transacylase, partial [Alphaproteobacteria bacterium]
PALAPAAKVVAERLATMPLATPTLPLMMNATAQATTDAATIQKHLVEQITSTVKWRESMAALSDRGVTTVLELGVGNVLAGLAKRQATPLTGHALNNPQTIDAYLATIL